MEKIKKIDIPAPDSPRKGDLSPRKGDLYPWYEINLRAWEIALERNGGKSNQTVCRGRSPLEKHFMGAVGELLVEYMLGATMDFNSYGEKGDGSNVDGFLPDGRGIVCKSVGPQLMNVWIPKVCLMKAPPLSIVVASRVCVRGEGRIAKQISLEGRIPLGIPENSEPEILQSKFSGERNLRFSLELQGKSQRIASVSCKQLTALQFSGSQVLSVLEASLLGWLSVSDFLKKGEVSYKHHNLKESVPGKALDRDICVIVPVTSLRKFML